MSYWSHLDDELETSTDPVVSPVVPHAVTCTSPTQHNVSVTYCDRFICLHTYRFYGFMLIVNKHVNKTAPCEFTFWFASNNWVHVNHFIVSASCNIARCSLLIAFNSCDWKYKVWLFFSSFYCDVFRHHCSLLLILQNVS